MKLTAVRALLILVFPFLLLNLGSCDSRQKQYSTDPSETLTPQSNKPNALTQQNSLPVASTNTASNTQQNGITQPNTGYEASTNTAPNTQQNAITQLNTQSLASTYTAAYAAEAYYQKILAQYGENYQQCLERVAVDLDEVASGETQQQPSSKQLNVLVVLDSSGSMVSTLGSKTKLDIAKEAIATFGCTALTNSGSKDSPDHKST